MWLLSLCSCLRFSLGTKLSAQRSAGSIMVTHNALIAGPSVVDPTGNIYATVQGGTTPGGSTFGGGTGTAEATPGAAQTTGGGCSFLGPRAGGNACTDAIAKTDPSGNVIFATFLGAQPTAMPPPSLWIRPVVFTSLAPPVVLSPQPQTPIGA